MKRMKARYDDTCSGCGCPIKAGSLIDYAGRGCVYHSGCAPSQDPAGDREYYKGRQDVERWHENKAIFGNEVAEQMEIEREMREGWDY